MPSIARITAYLADQTAGRCGPCFNGLPALAAAVDAMARGTADTAECERLARLVSGRGACAPPDGTARLVQSLLTTFPEEVAGHRAGACRATSVVASAS